MRKLTAGLALSVGLLGGAAGATVLVPGLAAAATAPGEVVADRLTDIRDALAGLVDDGTITQDQADKVAETLEHADLGHHGGPHGGPHGAHVSPDTVADALGISIEELTEALQDGKTLLEVAEDNGVTESELVDALVAAARQHLADGVADGRLTQEQADELEDGLEERISSLVDEAPGLGHRGGPGFGEPRSGGSRVSG